MITAYLVLYYGLIIISIIRLSNHYHKILELSPEKQCYAYIIAGATVFLLGMFLNTLSATGVDVYPMGIFCNVIFSLLCALAILRYQLLDINVFLRKGTAFILVSALAAGSYVCLFFLAYFFVSEIWSVSFWLNIVFVILLSLGLQPTLKWAQSRVDRWFFSERYDYLNALEHLAEETASITDLNFIAGSLVQTVTRAMSCSRAVVFLPDTEGQKYVTVCNSENPGFNSFVLSKDSVLIGYLSQKKAFLTRQEIAVLPQFSALPVDERQMLDDLDAQLLIPLLTMKGLRGILILSAKTGEEKYFRNEIKLLRVVANQMASIIDNARLYALERKMRLELEKTNQERTDFINALVHEIKTPITAMLASCDLLAEELADGPSIVGELTENLSVSIKNLNSRVSELTDFARLQSTEFKIKAQQVEMHKLIQRVGISLSGLLQNRGQFLRCDLAASTNTVKADPERLVQILMNLLTNASNYGQPYKGIELKTYNQNGCLVTEIRDTAAPLSIEDQTRLFQPYNLAAKKAGGGLGLGLFICKRLVDLHNGRIWMEAEETGNRFKFSLPVFVGVEAK